MIKQANQAPKPAIYERISLMSLIKGIVVSYIITIPIFIIFAFMLTYTDFPDKYIPGAVVITTIISLLIAGSTSTRNVKNKGWLNGAFVGLIYMLILYFLSSIVFENFTIDRYTITMLLIGLLTGAIGGIIGINIKHGSHHKYRE